MDTFREYIEPESPVGLVAELFAGVGGFRLGLARANLKTVFSNQWEPSTRKQHASDVYTSRFGDDGHLNVDIAKVESIPEVDLLVGGFPCQDYSVAKSLNSSKGLEGKKGVLWWEILRLISLRKPRFIFLENVDRLLKSPASQKGRDFAVMLKTLGSEGYRIEWRVVNAADYGFPQRRIRIFIIAELISEQIGSFERFLVDDGILAKAFPAKSSELMAREVPLTRPAYEISEDFNLGGGKSPFLNSGVFVDGVARTLSLQANFDGEKMVLGDILIPDLSVPEEYWIEEELIQQWAYLKGAKKIERFHKSSGARYLYAEGGMAFPDDPAKPSRTILTGEGGRSPSRFKHVVKTKRGFRRLTPIELERLNGFPDDWTRTGAGGQVSDPRRAFFMGNALVIGLVEKVGHEIAKRLKV